MRISKRALAREWLIFIALFPFGALTCFILGYYWTPFTYAYFTFAFFHTHPMPYGDSGLTPLDAFQRDFLGLMGLPTLLLWFVPYFAVTIVRSLWWAIKTLTAKAN